AARPGAADLPARPRSHHPLQGVPAAGRQDAGVPGARGRPLPDAHHPHARGVADRAHRHARAAAQRIADRGDRDGPRSRAHAVRGKVVDPAAVPKDVLAVLGAGHSARISRMVDDMVSASRLDDKRQIRMTDEVLGALIALRDYLYDAVYEKPAIRGEFEKAQRIITELWNYFHAHADEFRARHWPKGVPAGEDLSRAVGDF